MEPTDSSDNKLDEPSVSNDIYMLAFTSLLHSEEIEPGSGYIDKMILLNQERSSLFICAMKVACIQIAAAAVVFNFFIHGNKGKGFHYTVPSSFFVMLPRLISSLMMHLNVMEDVE